MRGKLGPARGSGRVRNGSSMRPHLDDPLGDAGQQRQIAADVRAAHTGWRSWCRTAGCATSLGTRKLTMPGFDHRIDHDHFAAAAAHVHQRAHQPRMIAGRIAADDEHQVGMFDVLERDRRRAGAQRAGQARRRWPDGSSSCNC